MKQALIYSLKVWLTTSIVSPILLTTLHLVFLQRNLALVHINQYDTPRAYHLLISKLPLMVAGNVVLLIPLCVALCYTTVLLEGRQLPVAKYKLYLSIVAVFFAPLVPLLLLGYVILVEMASLNTPGYSYDVTFNPVSTILVALASIWFYKLKPVKTVPILNTNL